jgi:hypothetical protein
LKNAREADAITTSRFTSIVIKRTTSRPWISITRYFVFEFGGFIPAPQAPTID